jgi:uncharacterized protein YjdB
MNIKNKRIEMKNKFLVCFAIVSITLNFCMPVFVVNAAITSNLPTSEIKENASDNSAVFPDSYKQYIRNLKIAHPNWTFKALYTGLDWTNSITHESYDVNDGISTVPGNSDNYGPNWKKNGVNTFIDGPFVIASKKAVSYSMDPRNFLNETGVFQFESLDYNSLINTSTIDRIISGTTMSSHPTQYKKSNNMVTLENGLTWSQIIINAARDAGKSIDSSSKGISSVFLASRMKQETSLEILNNGSINGSNSTYPGIYNFFNIGATPTAGQPNSSVTNGLAYASSKGWTTPAKSINAGATYIWGNYVKWGQNTIYFQKFDVSNPYGNAKALYAFQYMTNIIAPASESKISYNAYSNANMLNLPFVFYIPVYNNMPSTISPHPDSSTSSSLVYLDDTSDKDTTDVFNIRSQPSTSSDIIAKIVESKEGAENRTKFVRTEIGTNGWDKIKLSDGTEGYVSQSYVFEYTSKPVINVTGVTLDKTTSTLKVGNNLILNATVSPTNADTKTVSWSSSNNNVATVDTNGKVTAVGVGNATITVKTTDGNKISTCAITVEKTLVESINVSKTEYSLVIDKYLSTFTPEILPSTATDKSYDITITNTEIAKIENGKIKGLKIGSTPITIKTKDGSNKTSTFNLKVIEAAANTNNLTINADNIITKINLNTTVDFFKDKILPTSTNYTKKFIRSNGVELSINDKVGTGTKIQILDSNNLLEEYLISIYGDINGDANISSGDYVLIKNHIMSDNGNLNNIEKMSADYNKDGKISSSDYVLIKNYIMNK